MSSHADILDQKEPLGRSFAGSLILHVSVAAAIIGYGALRSPTIENWGDPNGGGMGSVAVNVVPTIRLPSTTGPKNPVANDTESHIPEPKPEPKVRPKPKLREPDADAIPIKDKSAAKRMARQVKEYTPPNTYRQQQRDLPNQLYSTQGQQVSSPLYAMTGAGGVGIGTDSPLGTRFGYYATLIRTKVAQHWHTNEVDPRISTAPEVVVRFTLRRDGSVVDGSARVVQSSGIGPLDISAQRAILDSSPFGALPPQFDKDTAELELHFILRR
ncbi:MAG TPA: TonB C-terminal domain-containing protein [Bryobacteraceae bacterium]|nr:TonB C-terminal domain-containing protein [Bryobacteraceae bacterium]